jgi:hypothetical protein
MEEVTIGFKSGKSITLLVSNVEAFILSLRQSLDNNTITCWSISNTTMWNVSSIEYVLPTKSIFDTK